MAMPAFQLLQIPLEHTQAQDVLSAAGGVLSRHTEKPAPHAPLARAIERLNVQLEAFKDALKAAALHKNDMAKQKAYVQERATLGALEYQLKAGLALTMPSMADRRGASKDMYAVLFKNGRAALARSTEALHAHVGILLGVIDDEFKSKLAVAEIESIIKVLKTAHAETAWVLNIHEQKEPPSVGVKKAAVVAAIKSVIMQANAWADDLESADGDPAYYLVPLKRWMARAQERRSTKRKAKKDAEAKTAKEAARAKPASKPNVTRSAQGEPQTPPARSETDSTETARPAKASEAARKARPSSPSGPSNKKASTTTASPGHASTADNPSMTSSKPSRLRANHSKDNSPGTSRGLPDIPRKETFVARDGVVKTASPSREHDESPRARDRQANRASAVQIE